MAGATIVQLPLPPMTRKTNRTARTAGPLPLPCSCVISHGGSTDQWLMRPIELAGGLGFEARAVESSTRPAC